MTTEAENRVGQMIRHTHPYGFRSGEWARVQYVVEARERECYLVEFADTVTDLWLVDDPDERYEFGAGYTDEGTPQ